MQAIPVTMVPHFLFFLFLGSKLTDSCCPTYPSTLVINNGRQTVATFCHVTSYIHTYTYTFKTWPLVPWNMASAAPQLLTTTLPWLPFKHIMVSIFSTTRACRVQCQCCDCQKSYIEENSLGIQLSCFVSFSKHKHTELLVLSLQHWPMHITSLPLFHRKVQQSLKFP